MRIYRNNGNKSLEGQGLDQKDQDKDLTHKDKDLTPKDQDNDLKYVLKEFLRTRINITDILYVTIAVSYNKSWRNGTFSRETARMYKNPED